MATPPTLVAEYEPATPWLSGTSPKTASVTTALADVLAIASGVEDRATAINLPTGGTGTYTNRQNLGPVGSFGRARIDTVSAGVTAQTYTLSQDTDSGTTWWGFGCYRFSGSDGVGASASINAAAAAPSLSITTTQDNSAILVVVVDWNAADGASRTWRTVNGSTGTEQTYQRNAAHYTAYVTVYGDAGAAGAKTVGLSAPAGQNYVIAAVEIKGAAAAAGDVPYAGRPQSQPRDAASAASAAWQLGRRYGTAIDASPPSDPADPVLGGWLPRRLARDLPATHADRRQAGQQPFRRADQSTGTPDLFDPTLAGSAVARSAPATHTDRREVPAQRMYPAAPDPVVPVVPVGTGALAAWWSDDPQGAFMAATLPRPADPSLLATADVPYAAPRPTPARDTRPWPQPRSTLTALTAAAADPLDPTLSGYPATARTAATHAERRRQGQQRAGLSVPAEVLVTVGTGALAAWWSEDPTPGYLAATQRRPGDVTLLGQAPGVPTDPTLSGWLPTRLTRDVPATHADRRRAPAQRTPLAAPDDVLLVGTGALVAWWGADDTVLYTQPRRPDASLLPAAVLTDPTLSGWLPGWLTGNQAATRAGRRQAGQQRPYLSDPSSYPAAGATDPLTLAWGVGGTYWLTYNTAALQVDRRETPQQRDRESDPGLLATALLEDALLGAVDDLARHRAWHAPRRVIVPQRAAAAPAADELDPAAAAGLLLRHAAVYADRGGRPRTPPPAGLPLPPAVLFDPTLSGWATGVLVRHVAASHASRRLVPAQPARLDGSPFAFRAGIVGAVTAHTASISGAVTTVATGIVGEIT